MPRDRRVSRELRVVGLPTELFDRLDLPATALCRAALDLARRCEHPAILHHSLRTFLHARLAAGPLGLVTGADFDPQELFVACVLHDVGASDRYDGPQRFEVEGADAASHFLASRGVGVAARRRVWEAIALHTSPGIAERLGALTRLTRAGVVSDFCEAPDDVPSAPSAATPAQRAAFEALLPRLEVRRWLADAVVGQALRNPAKAPASSWPGGLLQAHLAGRHVSADLAEIPAAAGDPAVPAENPAF